MHGRAIVAALKRAGCAARIHNRLLALLVGRLGRDHRKFLLVDDAVAFPIPTPAPPIIVGGETRGGAALAARIGDGWTSFTERFAMDLPAYLSALAEAGRDRASMRLIVGFQQGPGEALADSAWVRDPRGEPARWRDIGADEAVVTARGPEDVAALLRASAAW